MAGLEFPIETLQNRSVVPPVNYFWLRNILWILKFLEFTKTCPCEQFLNDFVA